jgi:hypothetical protein
MVSLVEGRLRIGMGEESGVAVLIEGLRDGCLVNLGEDHELGMSRNSGLDGGLGVQGHQGIR